jgi:hypothetical protein
MIGLMILVSCAPSGGHGRVARMAGVWESPGGFSYAMIELSADGSVEWCSGGCLDDAAGRCTGAMRGDDLVLSKPMEEYGGAQTRALHYRRVDGREYLLTDFDRDYASEKDEPFGPRWWCGMRRRLSRGELERRYILAQNDEQRARWIRQWCAWPVDLDGVSFLKTILHRGPGDEEEIEVRVSLEYTGCDDEGEVVDQSLYDAAQAVLRRNPYVESTD